MITYLELGMGIVANADLVYVCNVKNFIDDLLWGDLQIIAEDLQSNVTK